MSAPCSSALTGLLVLLFLSPLATGQIRDPGDDGDAWLALLDKRIDAARDLEGLSFRFRPRLHAPGQPDDTVSAGFLVRYCWRAGGGDRVDFLDLEGKELPAPDTAEAQKVIAKQREAYLLVARQLAGTVRGQTLAAQFETYQKRVLRRDMAEGEEVRLLLIAPESSAIENVVLHLDRRGLPWKRVKTMRNGDRATFHPTYEERDGRFLLTSLKRETEPAGGAVAGITMAWTFGYQRVQGRLLPNRVEVLGPNLPAYRRGATELLELRTGDRVPAFEAMPEPQTTSTTPTTGG